MTISDIWVCLGRNMPTFITSSIHCWIGWLVRNWITGGDRICASHLKSLKLFVEHWSSCHWPNQGVYGRNISVLWQHQSKLKFYIYLWRFSFNLTIESGSIFLDFTCLIELTMYSLFSFTWPIRGMRCNVISIMKPWTVDFSFSSFAPLLQFWRTCSIIKIFQLSLFVMSSSFQITAITWQQHSLLDAGHLGSQDVDLILSVHVWSLL